MSFLTSTVEIPTNNRERPYLILSGFTQKGGATPTALHFLWKYLCDILWYQGNNCDIACLRPYMVSTWSCSEQKQVSCRNQPTCGGIPQQFLNHWGLAKTKYRKTSYISRTLVGNKIVDNSDVVGASPVGAAPTTSSFSTYHMASIDWAKTTAAGYKTHLNFRVWCDLY